jgi:hypothetical protein
VSWFGSLDCAFSQRSTASTVLSQLFCRDTKGWCVTCHYRFWRSLTMWGHSPPTQQHPNAGLSDWKWVFDVQVSPLRASW